jgi:hypothetical protein
MVDDFAPGVKASFGVRAGKNGLDAAGGRLRQFPTYRRRRLPDASKGLPAVVQ